MDSTITDEELATLKKKAFEVLSHARHTLLTKYPFIGSIALRMDLVPVRDVRVRTACTDGNCVYFDIAFLSSLSNEERIFVLAHEIWHAVLLHLTRRGTRNPQLFNIATDKEVNYLLKQDGLTPPSHLCFPEGNEVGKCAEEIYEMMLKDMKKQQKNKQQSSGSGSGSGSSSGNGKKNQKQNSSGSGQNGSGQPEENDDPSGGNKDGKLEGQFDKHIYDGDEQQNKGNGSQQNGNGKSGENKDGDCSNGGSKIVDKYGEVGYDSDFQPQVPRGFADRMRETVIAEAQRCEKMKGNVPAHVKELVKKMLSAELPWTELLAQFVTKCYNSGNRSWIPPNRRHVHNDVYLQSRQASKIKICVGIDTSGSTMGDRSKFLGELNGLIKSFGFFDLAIIECDAEVGSCKHYTQDDNLDSILEEGEYAMTGGGGTAMRPIYDYILDHQIECDAIVIMTDGFIDHIEKNPIPSIPTLWVITKDGTDDFCDWGQKIHLNKNDSDLN